MRIRRLWVWLLVVCCMPVQAQISLEYSPFDQEGKIWETRIGTFKENVFCHRIDGDTLIDGETWKKVYTYFEVPLIGYSYYAAVRDVDKKVYAIAKGSNRPRLLYDFNMKVGNTVRCGVEGNAFYCLLDKGEQPDSSFGFKMENYLRLERIDTIDAFGLRLRRFTLSLLDVFREQIVSDVVWLEGVGSCLNPFAPWLPLPSRDRLFFFKKCKIGNRYIAVENDFYDDDRMGIPSGNYSGSEESNLIYNLQGIPMREPSKGVIIKKRKKFIVK